MHHASKIVNVSSTKRLIKEYEGMNARHGHHVVAKHRNTAPVASMDTSCIVLQVVTQQGYDFQVQRVATQSVL
jgi:hypothetical protein